MNKKWVVKKRTKADIILQLLLNRGIDPKDKEKFFNPSFEDDLHDPMKLPHIKKAISIVKEIRKKNIPTAIWGDYDTDGVTSTALLYEAFEKLGIKPEVYIPTREEGYGLNIAGIDSLHKKGIEAIFALDCGVTNSKEVDYANSLGLKMVILDHHLPEKEIPKAVAVIDTKIPESKYPFNYLSAGGVVFKFIQALHKIYPKIITESFVKWSLDLAGISTAADLVELKDENRTLMKYAFLVLPKLRRVGLKALFEVSGIDPQTITMYTLWYLIGPRLNAPGRMKDANLAFKILIEKDDKKALEYAKFLDKQNRERQDILAKALEEAESRITQKEVDQKKIIIIGSRKWLSGIVGLIAGKLTEKYNVPTLVYSEGRDASKGSARSIEAFDVTAALRQAKKYLISCGGHKMAAGFSFKNKDLDLFKKKLEKIAKRKIKKEDLTKKIKIDAKIKLREINLDFYEELKKFEPTGFGNPKIIFLAKDVEIKQVRGVGKDCKHLKLSLALDHKKITAETAVEDKLESVSHAPFEPSHSAIAFDQGHWCKNLKVGEKIDIVFCVDEDSWGGTRRVDLKIIDLRRSN
ncbi:single-stranded-DNA-specific exonuclease RecJ [Patescibacteria group bacterium]|nr:single-stranded-DNA-specific exonuclease RecJ [Patescibacteria group bacterium]